MGRLVKVTEADPDGEGPEVSPVTMYEFDEAGNQVAMVDALGRRTEYVYDGRDRLVETVYPDGSIERMGYDVDNNPTSTTDAEGNESDRVFDARGRIISQTDPLGNTTTLEYDGANQLIAQVDANNKRTEFEYDDHRRRTAVTDALDTAVASTTETEYDLAGNIIAEIDANNQKTEYVYDNLNRQTQVIDAKDVPGITITEYDDLGNVVAVTDPANNTTTFGYDARNRKISSTNELDATRSFEYDGVGNQIAAVDRNDRRREFVYDGLNRLTEENWLDDDGSKVRTITYTFDAAGQLTQVSDPDSTYFYTYDLLGRRTSVDNAGTPGVPNVVLNYSYDSQGKLVSVTDTIDGVEEGTISYSYDDRDRVAGITNSGSGVADKRVDFSYNNIGQLSSINRYSDLDGSQLVTGSTYSYDEKNRLQNLSHGSSAFYEFEYDGGDRPRQIVDVDGTTDYEYDKTNQLTVADRSDPNNPDESYSYDANGNRVTSHLHDGDYATGANNRLESDGVYSYSYDAEGNLIRRTEVATGQVTEYSWDYRNRLVAVTEFDAGGNGTKEVEFSYAASGDRLSKTVDDFPDDDVEGVTTYFVSDRSDVLLEFVDADGAGDASEPVLVLRYLHGPQVDQILASEDGDGETLWHLSDHLGTVRDLVDNDGEVLNHLVYDSFGRVVSQTDETVGSRYRFTGREFDEETGLYYYRARYYDGDVGRFISSDPIGFAGGDVNLYRYVKNNSINRIDPSGMKDTRWPTNGSVTNNSSKPVIILNGNQSGDYPEALYPGQSTPDSPGRSKDADGVWVCRENKWVFYGVYVGNIKWVNLQITPITSPLTTPGELNIPVPVNMTFGDVIVTDNQVRDRSGRILSPDLPQNRGRKSSNNLFVGSCDCESVQTTAQQYPNAAVWRPVLPQDSWEGSYIEQILSFPGQQTERLKDWFENGIDNMSNPSSWRWQLF